MNATAKTTKTTAHATCTHPATRQARAACRKAKKAAPAIETVTAYGVELEIKTVHVSEITNKDMIWFAARTHAGFTPVSVGGFRPYTVLPGSDVQEFHNHYTITIGGTQKIVPLDTTYVVAADPKAAKRAAAAYRRNLLAKFSN